MIRESKNSVPVINLDGPDGNAFALMAYAKLYARDVVYASDEIEYMVAKMRSGDYKNLVKVFDEYFDGFVVLETADKELLA